MRCSVFEKHAPQLEGVALGQDPRLRELLDIVCVGDAQAWTGAQRKLDMSGLVDYPVSILP